MQHRRSRNGAKPQGGARRWRLKPEATLRTMRKASPFHRSGGARPCSEERRAQHNGPSQTGENDRNQERVRRAAHPAMDASSQQALPGAATRPCSHSGRIRQSKTPEAFAPGVAKLAYCSRLHARGRIAQRLAHIQRRRRHHDFRVIRRLRDALRRRALFDAGDVPRFFIEGSQDRCAPRMRLRVRAVHHDMQFSVIALGHVALTEAISRGTTYGTAHAGAVTLATNPRAFVTSRN